MFRAILEGTPASFPVAPAGTYWEAGAIAGFVSTTGQVGVWASGLPIGLLADRRSTKVGITQATFLPSNVGNYGDESLFNQPGYGNSLYGTTSSTFGGPTNNVIPANTVPTTTLLVDETGVNPNSDSRYVTVYVRGGVYETDQFDSTLASANPGATLYVLGDGSGRLTTTTSSAQIVGVLTKPVNGNGFVEFKLTLV